VLGALIWHEPTLPAVAACGMGWGERGRRPRGGEEGTEGCRRTLGPSRARVEERRGRG